MLSKEQAEKLVYRCLKARCAGAELLIEDWSGRERAFGWVFTVNVAKIDAAAPARKGLPRWIIVNKYSQQVIASSVASDVKQFVRLYEKLLAHNQAARDQWCGTPRRPFPWSLWRKQTVAERAKEGGFYEIGGAEEHHE